MMMAVMFAAQIGVIVAVIDAVRSVGFVTGVNETADESLKMGVAVGFVAVVTVRVKMAGVDAEVTVGVEMAV